MQILIILLVLGLIGMVIEFLSEYGAVIIGIAAVILVIGIIIAIFPLIISLLPYIIIFLAIGIAAKKIRDSHMEKKAGLCLEWLDNVGVIQLSTVPVDVKIWKRLEEKGSAVRLSSGYTVSIKFCGTVLGCLEQQQIMLETEFQNCCLRAVPQFDVKYTNQVLEFFQREKAILPFSPQNGKRRYISSKVIKKCECLFEDEGAATKDEFAEICGKSLFNPCLYKERHQLATVTLESMKSKGKIHKVNLGQIELYISNNKKANSKMTRVVINMDD